MTDGYTEKEELAEDGTSTPGAEPEAPVVDSWASAFASLEEKDTAAPADSPEGEVQPEGDVVPGDVAPAGGLVDDGVDAGDAGGPVPAAGEAGDADADQPVTAEAAAESIQRLTEEVSNRAIQEVSQAFLERTDDQGRKLIRQTDGKLGATINDPDIYRVDEDSGVPTFFNPDTGRPFSGDNPRAQAKAWVEAYNEELRETFNRIAETRTTELQSEIAPIVQLLEFMPTYEGLDPVRQKMLDGIIGDYEVYDSNGDHIGYSVDLNQALNQVNRQVTLLKEQRKAEAPPATSSEPSGPALDMPTTGGSTGSKPQFKSLSEAMEWEQNQQLEKLRKK